MISSKKFEAKLISLGYKLVETENRCNHDVTHTVFNQDTFDYDSKLLREVDILWFRYAACLPCCEGYLGTLSCGGYYNNIRFYQSIKNNAYIIFFII